MHTHGTMNNDQQHLKGVKQEAGRAEKLTYTPRKKIYWLVAFA